MTERAAPGVLGARPQLKRNSVSQLARGVTISSDPTFEWHVPLSGHEFDLEDFPLWLSGEPCRVERHDGAYYLVLPTEIAGSTYELVRQVAEHYVELLNGLGRLLGQNFKPLTIGNSFRGVDANGFPTQTVVVLDGVESRSTAGSFRVQLGSTLLPDSRQGAASPYLLAAASSTKARSALRLLGQPHLAWTDLYILFEFVEEDVGRAMYDREWISRAQATRFTSSANSFTLLGIGGRHGKERGAPPASPMTHQEAVQAIVGLITRWLEHVADRAPGAQAG